jgi:hypothetical protein
MSIPYRPLTEADLYATFQIFQGSVMAITGGHDSEVIAGLFEKHRPLREHLTRTAEHQWNAERDEQPVGYARSDVPSGKYSHYVFTIPPFFPRQTL